MPGTRALVAALALAVGVVLVPTPVTAAVGTGSFMREEEYSAALGEQIALRRRLAGIEPVYPRSEYHADAEALAVAAASSQPLPAVRDNAPSYASSLTLLATQVDYWVNRRIETTVQQLSGLIASPLHTDVGWSVMAYREGTKVYVGIAAVVGWARPAVGSNTACTGWGFCWTNRGLNPHLPWTRTRVAWKLSRVGLPAGGEAVVRDAIARISAVPGVGAELVYGGLTSATAPTGTDRFVVAWSSGCTAASLGCAAVHAYGGTRLIYAARVIVNPARYDPAARDLNAGTVAHEIAHSMGLGHFDGRLADGYQLMRSGVGANSPRTGDRNGLRTLNPPGQVSARLSLVTVSVAVGGVATAVLHGESTGLGSLRYLGVDCTDGSGVWRTVASISGVLDPRGRDARLSWVTTGSARTALCRGVVRSRHQRVESAYAALHLS